MITTRELNFVTTRDNRVPYPGLTYAEKATEKLTQAFENFNEYYSNKEYDIILSNGEQILFQILSMNLCHMLGIETKK